MDHRFVAQATYSRGSGGGRSTNRGGVAVVTRESVRQAAAEEEIDRSGPVIRNREEGWLGGGLEVGIRFQHA